MRIWDLTRVFSSPPLTPPLIPGGYGSYEEGEGPSTPQRSFIRSPVMSPSSEDVERRLGQLASQYEGMEARMDRLESRLSGMDSRLERIDEMLTAVLSALRGEGPKV